MTNTNDSIEPAEPASDPGEANRVRQVTQAVADGRYTLDDLAAFVEQARRVGVPGTAYVEGRSRLRGRSRRLAELETSREQRAAAPGPGHRSGRVTGVPVRTGNAVTTALPVAEPDVPIEQADAPRWIGPRSIANSPLTLGPTAAGEFAVDLTRESHGLFTGHEQVDLENLTTAHLYETTRSTDCLTWFIVSPDHAQRRLRPWLAPWLDEQAKAEKEKREPALAPALDWVAPSWPEACAMLLDAYKAVAMRAYAADSPTYRVTDQTPQITIFIAAEKPTLLTDTRECPVPAFDGRHYTFAELLVKVLKVAEPEAIRVYTAALDTVGGHGGIGGGTNLHDPGLWLVENSADIRAQCSYRIALHNKRYRSAGAFSTAGFAARGTSSDGDLDLTALAPNEFYAERRDDREPVKGRTFQYSPDDVAWAAANHGQHAGTMDNATAAELDHYSGRWTRPNQLAFFDLLTSTGAAE